MAREKKDHLEVAIVIVALLFGLLLICGGGGAAYYLYQRAVAPAPLAAEVDGALGGADAPPIVEPPGAGDDEASRQAAVDAMRPRYVPGPYVEVEGLLPAGLRSLRRMAPGSPTAHALDNPWVVPGSELRGGELPAASPEGSPGMELASAAQATPLHVIPGAPSTLTVVASDGEGAGGEVEALLVAFDGYEGFFYLPAAAESELGRIQISGLEKASFHFGIDAPVAPGGEPALGGKPLDVVMRVASVDASGRVSTPVERTLRVLPLGRGDLEVTLTMDRATDLDLYVAGPTGNMVYYEHTRGFGAELDLDANAACERNQGVNNEHVFFAEAGAVAGTYHVRVAHYRSCIGDADVGYRVTVRNCGETAVLRGSFEGEGNETVCKGDPGDDRGWCQQVVSFEVTPCRAL